MIVVEESDEGAFKRAESLVRRQYLTEVQIADLAIVEKKKTGAGVGYVLIGEPV